LYNIVFVGAPGAGKGTQASMVAQKLNMVHISSGDLFRQALEQGTELGKQVKTYMEKGALVPDEITIQMVMERMSAPDSENGVILDGFPRNLPQAEALDGAAGTRGKTIGKVIYIKVSEEELIKRLSGRWLCRQCQAVYNIWGVNAINAEVSFTSAPMINRKRLKKDSPYILPRRHRSLITTAVRAH